MEVGLQRIGICTRWKLYRTYKFRVLLELLEGLRKAGVMEIVEDRLVSVQGSAITQAMLGLVTHTGRPFVDRIVRLT